MKNSIITKNTNQISSAFCGMLMFTVVVFYKSHFRCCFFEKLLEDSVNLYFII